MGTHVLNTLDQDGVTYRKVVKAIIDTCLKTDGTLEGYPYVAPSPNLPCVMVTLETDLSGGIQTMDRQVYTDRYRLWVCEMGTDSEEEAYRLYDRIDSIGPRSLMRAFAQDDAPWREVAGLKDLWVEGFARLPLDIQGPGMISFGGPNMWAMALIVRANYGN